MKLSYALPYGLMALIANELIQWRSCFAVQCQQTATGTPLLSVRVEFVYGNGDFTVRLHPPQIHTFRFIYCDVLRFWSVPSGKDGTRVCAQLNRKAAFGHYFPIRSKLSWIGPPMRLDSQSPGELVKALVGNSMVAVEFGKYFLQEMAAGLVVEKWASPPGALHNLPLN